MTSVRRFVLITGASRGIGAATALGCARAGWDVGISYQRDEASARRVEASCAAAGARTLVVQADVAEPAQVMAMFSALDAAGFTLGALVNNAGIVDVKSRVDAMSTERLQRMFATNVVGSILCAREAVKRLSTALGGTGGAIVNLSSMAAVLGSPGQYVDYAASKGAIDTFTIGLARELAAEGVRVNAVRPGIIDTDIHASGGEPDRAQRSAALVPMKRPGTAEEVAAAIVWLLSQAASYTTGAILDVSGGR